MTTSTWNDSLDSMGSTFIMDARGDLGPATPLSTSPAQSPTAVPTQPQLRGVHLQFFHLYRDYHGLASLSSSASHLKSVLERCTALRSTARDVKAVLANMRRSAMTYLLLGLPLKALAVAEQIVRLQFDWPYGHIMQADALLALDRLVAASSAYQLALHLMVVSEPANDVGRAEVLQLCQDVVEFIALQCCRTLTLAHDQEVTSIAAWPPPAPAWASSDLQNNGLDGAPLGYLRSERAASDLRKHVDNAVNSALEVISQTGCIASGFQLSSGGRDGSFASGVQLSSGGRDNSFASGFQLSSGGRDGSSPGALPGVESRGRSGAAPALDGAGHSAGLPCPSSSRDGAARSAGPPPGRPSAASSGADTMRSAAPSSASGVDSSDARGKSRGLSLNPGKTIDSLNHGKTIDNLLSDEMERACRAPHRGSADSQPTAAQDFESFADIFNTGASSAVNSPAETILTSRSGDALASSSPPDRQPSAASAFLAFPAAPSFQAAVPAGAGFRRRRSSGQTWKHDATLAAFAGAELPLRSMNSTQDYELVDSPFMSTENEAGISMERRSGSGSPCKRFIATASMDCTVKVWDVELMGCVNVLEGHEEGVTLLAWADSCRNGLLLMASASVDGVVVIWVLDMDGALLEQRILLGHRSRVTNMTFTPSRSKLITAGADGTICIWRVSTGKLLGKLSEHTRGITSLATLPINGVLAVASSDTAGKWCLWDFDSRACVVTGRGRHGCSSCKFTPCIPTLTPPRPLLLTCHWSQSKSEATVHLWDVFDSSSTAAAALEPVHVFEGCHGRISDISVVVDANQHALLAIGCMDGGLTIVDLGSRTVLSQIRDAHIDSEGYVMPILQVVFSLDGRLLFTSGADCTIKVWSTADMEVLLTLRGHSSPVTSLASCDGGASLASGSDAGELAIWGLELVEELASSAVPGFRA